MSSNWWFSAFRQQGAPTWYGDNRTAVITDTTTVKIAVIFSIFLIAFLVIFPGIRRAKWTSFVSITLALTVGALIVVCIYYPSWHVAELQVVSPYKAFSTDRLHALLGVNVGLKVVNITLKGAPEGEAQHHLNYNERFTFYEVKSMQNDLHEGLEKGLPYPILSIIEYFSVDKAGFVWGRRYRLAGYYTCILLWLSFALWLLHLLMLCLIPQFYSRTLICLGSCILLSNVVYLLSSPKSLLIPFSNASGGNRLLTFEFGWCFWATLAAGFACFLFGSLIRLLESKWLFKFTTFLQLDFDELYDSAGNLQTANFDERLFGNNVALCPATILDPGPALNQGKDQFVEEDEPPKSAAKLVKSGSSDVGSFRGSPAASGKSKKPETVELSDDVVHKWSSDESLPGTSLQSKPDSSFIKQILTTTAASTEDNYVSNDSDDIEVSILYSPSGRKGSLGVDVESRKRPNQTVAKKTAEQRQKQFTSVPFQSTSGGQSNSNSDGASTSSYADEFNQQQQQIRRSPPQLSKQSSYNVNLSSLRIIDEDDSTVNAMNVKRVPTRLATEAGGSDNVIVVHSADGRSRNRAASVPDNGERRSRLAPYFTVQK